MTTSNASATDQEKQIIELENEPLENSGEFPLGTEADALAAANDFSLSNKEVFVAVEEATSSWTYPAEYTGPKPIKEQVEILATAFNLSSDLAMTYIDTILPKLSLPEGADGWFAILSPKAMAAQHVPDVTDPREQHCKAVELILNKIDENRHALHQRRCFRRTREEELIATRFRQHRHTTAALNKIAATQKGDIWIIGAQFGLRHRGRSVRRARELFTPNEFALDTLAFGSMLLVHPERFINSKPFESEDEEKEGLKLKEPVREGQLHADCGGDEYDFDGWGTWTGTPCFHEAHTELRFCMDRIVPPYVSYAPVTGFFPE